VLHDVAEGDQGVHGLLHKRPLLPLQGLGDGAGPGGVARGGAGWDRQVSSCGRTRVKQGAGG
jgi:hypothetical protein